uniref:Uncharacterized protein n=1 Tax=Plectus sambesii TaxID=2011161 RepID=A0A914WIZ8_9BILA
MAAPLAMYPFRPWSRGSALFDLVVHRSFKVRTRRRGRIRCSARFSLEDSTHPSGAERETLAANDDRKCQTSVRFLAGKIHPPQPTGFNRRQPTDARGKWKEYSNKNPNILDFSADNDVHVLGVLCAALNQHVYNNLVQ